MKRVINLGGLAAVLLCLGGCAAPVKYWNDHPEEFVPAGTSSTKELVFYRPAVPTSSYKMSVAIGNDSARPLRFAKYQNGKWVGAGVTLELQPSYFNEVGDVQIDYSPLSGRTIWPRDTLHGKSAPSILITIPRSAYSLGGLRPVRTELNVIFRLQEANGQILPVSKTAYLKPLFLILGFEEPVLNRQPAL